MYSYMHMDCESHDNRSFWQHLDELRVRLIWIIVSWTVGVCIIFPFSQVILAYLSRPVGKLIFLAPSEALLIYIKMSLWGGLVLAFPVVIYQIFIFLLSGLRKHERTAVLGWCAGAIIGCFMGGAFAHYVMIPLGLSFLLGFASSVLSPFITASAYVTFYINVFLVSCLIFEIPLVVMFLARWGLVDACLLARYRRHIFVTSFCASAVLTPPDVITQILMALPLYVLYEISIIGARFIKRRGVGRKNLV